MSPQPRLLRLGCGDIWESVVSQPWPKTRYQFLQLFLTLLIKIRIGTRLFGLELSTAYFTNLFSQIVSICIYMCICVWSRFGDSKIVVTHKGPFTRYVNLWVAHVPGMPGTFSPPCITARAWRSCRDACRDACRDCSLAVSFLVGGGENVLGIPGACAVRKFTNLVRGPWRCLTRDTPKHA